MNRKESIFPKSLIEQLPKTNDNLTSRTLSIKWGKENEAVALKKYKTLLTNSLQVKLSGFVVNPQWPWLGGSPDGLLCDNNKAVGAVEIKCPYSKRNMSLSDACEDKKFYLQLREDKIHLKEKYLYYYQCQGIMNITNLP